MALDIQALARQAMTLAKSLAAQAFETVTVRRDPTIIQDISNDSHAAIWNDETSLSALRFDDQRIREEVDLPPGNIQLWLIDLQDLPGPIIRTNDQIEDSAGVTWEIFRFEPDPTNSVGVVYSRSA